MIKCIYCLKDNNKTTFQTREHVIPQSLGTFAPLNPVIKDRIVCDDCNTKILSPLETNFIEDSIEGFTAQRLNLNNRNSITMRNNSFKVDTESGFGGDFFNQMIFLLKPQDGKLVPYQKAQVKFRGLGGKAYRIFFPEALKDIKKDSKKFRNVVSDIKKLSHNDICMFAETHEEINEIQELLKEYGIEYKEGSRHREPFEEESKFKLSEDYTCTINKTVSRVLTKIALNYFAYCCIQDNREDILFLSQ